MSDKEDKSSTWFYHSARIVLLILYRIFFRFKAYGIDNIPKEARGIIFAPNHASYLDPPAVGIALNQAITYLAKDYLFKPWIAGKVLRGLGVLPLEGESDSLGSIRQLLRILKSGKRVVVFPEGTRTVDGCFQNAEPGVGFLAAKSESYVVPVYIQGSFEAYPKGAKHVKYKPIRVYYGKAFLADEVLIKNKVEDGQERYRFLSREILNRVKKIKEEVESENKRR